MAEPKQVIQSIDQVTPEWLTYVLTRSGALTGGRVAAIAIESGERILSTSTRLRIAYSEGATGALPPKLFLKTVNVDQDEDFFGASEVNYYLRDYKGVACAPIPRCYDAVFSEEQRCYHLLLDDLADTHIEAKHKPRTLEYGLALAEGLACLHAAWWGGDRLADVGEQIPVARQIDRFVEIAQPGAGHIIGAYSRELKAYWPAAVEEILQRHPSVMIARTNDSNGFTLIHGDPNWNNILVPHNADRPLYIIDRQPFDWSLTVWLGVYDLAYALVLDWDIDERRRFEMPILRHYHDRLMTHGVRDYTWEQLLLDYRLSVPICVYVAIEWCRGGVNEPWVHIWLPMLQQAMTACDDLNCRELWG
ncbi:MAG TPA: phosphotransferase [Promineifilum sp.]|nr:phosphotransferase [Promineifilum sp.]HRO89446.1 phosphotransferase [Promineifilum sp.]HRQ12384.1 phosphotransferase [Promineifilum sp.]